MPKNQDGTGMDYPSLPGPRKNLPGVSSHGQLADLGASSSRAGSVEKEPPQEKSQPNQPLSWLSAVIYVAVLNFEISNYN